MKTIELIEMFKTYQLSHGHMPSGAALSPRDVADVQDDLMADYNTAVVEGPIEARRVPTPTRDGDVYAMTLVGVPVFMRRDAEGVEMWGAP